jgi:nucleotide-binding universal stress UspA family protein
MFPLTSVFCPIDFSDHSRRVLGWAAALAVRDGARLTVASFLEPLLSDAAATIDALEGLQRDTERQIHEWVETSVPAGTTWRQRPVAIARRGNPDEEIVRAAKETSADLIVMGTHGLTGVRKLVLGSTTASVLGHTGIPVLAVPFGAPDLLAGGGALSIDRVLVATDLGETSLDYVNAGADVARSFHAGLTLVHVIDGHAGAGHGGQPASTEDRVRTVRSTQQLDEQADRVSALGPIERLRRFGAPADEIAVAAVELRASVIVMGLVAGHGLVARRPGTVAYRVACLSSVPVLVIPPSAQGARSSASTDRIETNR